MKNLLYLLVLSLFISGCVQADQAVPLPTQSPLPSPALPTETAIPTPTMLPATEAPVPVVECVTLFYEDYAQVELISPSGTRILVDIREPGLLSSPVTESDVLLTTHTHWDHINTTFQQGFPGQQLMTSAGQIILPDVNIKGIPSAHNAGDALKQEGGTNYIYLIEMSGLRIAHFGDIGQDGLNDDQLSALGKLDIAITQFLNPYSDMSAENEKGFKLMSQLEPRLLIPTHLDLTTARMASLRWQGLYTEKKSVQVCKSNLSEQTQILLMGEWAIKFGERLALSKVDW